MPSNILLTGGSGLLALNWAAEIRGRDKVVLGLHERSVALSGVVAQKIDLESADELARTIEAGKFDLVIHTAGFTSVEGCEARPDRAQHANVQLASNVAAACAVTGSLLAHISTDHLFSGNEIGVSEDHPVAPQNVYGRTKSEAERQVLAINPNALVVRTNFYGWGTRYRTSFSDAILARLRSRSEISLFSDVFYTPILIEALVRAVHDLVRLKARGVYHVAGDERLSKHEFGLRIAKEFGLDSGLIKSAMFASQEVLVRRPFDMSLSNEKVSKLLDRNLGGVNEQLARLRRQEEDGLARELRQL
jgi:dTDP-4-dehydrorhamnose reductase